MKRCSQVLVSYSSSEEEDDDDVEPPKKRKLPSLSSSLLIPIPTDRPALHQGRIRAQPHVEGQWVAHVYVSLIVERRSNLFSLMDDVFTDARMISPTLTDFWSGDELYKKRHLHISLSRPIYLRAHQREELKIAVKGLSKKFAPFTVSFATFSELVNDERTRTFLTMEVGAGHHELRAISNALTPALQAIRQKEFYPDPRFHASIAWALLDRPPSLIKASSSTVADDSSILTEGTTLRTASPTFEPVLEPEFRTIPHLPKDLVPSINDRYSDKLSSIKTGTFDVNEIAVKIGKDVFTWRLSGL